MDILVWLCFAVVGALLAALAWRETHYRRLLRRVSLHLSQVEYTLEQRRTSDLTLDNLIAALLGSDHIGLFVVDALHHVVMMGRGMERLLGISAAQAQGQPLLAQLRDYEVDHLIAHCLHERGVQPPIQIIHNKRHLLISAHYSGSAGVGQCLVIVQDVTELHYLRTVRRDFVANISHELRTPLTTIRLLVETLQNGVLDDRATSEEYLTKVEREVVHLSDLVEQLLALSRSEAGQDHLNLRPVALAAIVEGAIERLDSLAIDRQTTIQNTVPVSLPLLSLDAGKMTRVVLNLMHNAITYSPPGSIVSVWAEQSTATVTLVVRDNGVGISSVDLPRIFERFYRSDRARMRTSGSTGLGLAIARHVVEAHHGRIWAESEEGHGATFFIALPIDPSMI